MGAAINFENKHKPAGSKLVIANSSETIIPAAGGLGVQDLIKAVQYSSQSGGGTSVGNINVTVNAGEMKDPDKVAYLVAQRLSDAIGQVRSAAIEV